MQTKKIAVLVPCFLFFVVLVSMYRQYTGNGHRDPCLESMLTGPVLPDQLALLEVIRNKFLMEPSTQPYSLLGRRNIASRSIEASQKFYYNVTRTLFKNKKNGVFIEAGALDGETMSNTLKLETKQNWTGILIEPDPVSFKALVGKNRKAWLANVALSPFTYPIQKLFAVGSQYVDTDAGMMSFGFKMRAMHGLPDFSIFQEQDTEDQWHFYVQCFPLESLLRALHIRKVDLLSLDVEGPEIDILKNFPFEKFDVQVLYVEWKAVSRLKTLEDFMFSKGYELFAHRREDCVFVKKGSLYLDF